MLEEHGELATPEGLAREADRAVLNEARMRFIAREQSQLQRATSVRQVAPGQRHTTDLLLKAAKIQAEAIVSRLKLSEVRPKQYAAAAARNARQASQSMADLPKAAEFKRNQLANRAAARAASEAQDEIKAAGEFFKKVVGTSDEKIKKTRDVDVVNAARAVLALYGFGAKAKTAGEYLEKVAAYDPEMHQVLAQSVAAAEAQAKPFNDLTVQELRDLRTEIEKGTYPGIVKTHLDGVNQADFLQGKAEKSARDTFFYYSGTTPSAVRYKNWKMYYTIVPDTGTGGLFGAQSFHWTQLANIKRDPFETTVGADAK
jgi:hypothetical protein